MCDFISWLEDSKGVLHYLTDKECFIDGVLSPILEGCKDNDIIGHGAIEKFYGIKGKHVEIREFWKLEKLPTEIADLVRTPEEFLKNFGKMFNYFQADDLRYVIRYAPESYKELAWNMLIKQGQTNDDLAYIIEYAPKPYQELACKQLLKQEPSNDDLTYIIGSAPEPYADLARKLFKK